jgi:spermidine/putrescine transport system substrate-binding protein
MKELNRRKFLACPVGVIAASVGVAGCDRGAVSTVGKDGRPIFRLKTWTSFLDPGLITRFEERAGCRVEHTFFSTNEELFTTLDAGQEAFDVVTPSSYMTTRLVREGKLRKLDLAKSKLATDKFAASPLPEAAALAAADFEYGLPFSWSVSGIAVNGKQFKEAVTGWRTFEVASLSGRYTLLDDMRELLGAGLKAMGKSLNSVEVDELGEAAKLVSGWVSSARKLNNTDYCFGLIAGEYLACHGYDGDVDLAKAGEPALVFSVPAEGAPVAVDELCIAANATRPDLAFAFIEFMAEPTNARQNAIWSNYGTLNRAAQSDAYSADISKKLQGCEMIADLGANTLLWETTWQKLLER